jgi:hypothetical protein
MADGRMDAAWGLQRRRALAADVGCLLVILSSASCGDSPTRPDRYGIPQVIIICEPASSSSTRCLAPVSCSVDPCRPGTPTDATTIATWNVDDPAVVRVTAGRKAISGELPEPVPGAVPLTAPGMYRIDGVPSGTVTIRVTKEGYLDQEREVTGVQFSNADFYLQRR